MKNFSSATQIKKLNLILIIIELIKQRSKSNLIEFVRNNFNKIVQVVEINITKINNNSNLTKEKKSSPKHSNTAVRDKM